MVRALWLSFCALVTPSMTSVTLIRKQPFQLSTHRIEGTENIPTPGLLVSRRAQDTHLPRSSHVAESRHDPFLKRIFELPPTKLCVLLAWALLDTVSLQLPGISLEPALA